mmetsp:Transcript_16275/g.32998  ORF Transcript_16275/g.32998 Transcript_16275/m.32998 type:complete len:83 (-) Transcript_16275:295-543(-)
MLLATSTLMANTLPHFAREVLYQKGEASSPSSSSLFIPHLFSYLPDLDILRLFDFYYTYIHSCLAQLFVRPLRLTFCAYTDF